MENLRLTPQDILKKEFKPKRMGVGFDPNDVDTFLDEIMKDYDTFNKNQVELQNENRKLRAQIEELNRQLAAASSQKSVSQPTTGATNMDILKRLSNLERRVFGSQVDYQQNSGSHIL
ncbi:cell division regulator GpsB [Periweissella beninensis]|uniref:Cell division regulator GpsB n=1 Tax=Periweissella beninensis TaxID=504936 RepID=A0ABT0VJL4_9LACO|nr:cell division regulator GpsB [Periweissella beninensis]MBM7544523.1 DivIVA domain-containing protein [Periweissella beninensis]MCM2438021.1 cell division regulator GpsB [Periweissella beninensis]MCT4396938.1 cell division regulator GpsB [Periweissella beninensis]